MLFLYDNDLKPDDGRDPEFKAALLVYEDGERSPDYIAESEQMQTMFDIERKRT